MSDRNGLTLAKILRSLGYRLEPSINPYFRNIVNATTGEILVANVNARDAWQWLHKTHPEVKA